MQEVERQDICFGVSFNCSVFTWHKTLKRWLHILHFYSVSFNNCLLMFSYSISYNFSFVYLFQYVLYSINLNSINAILTKKHSYKNRCSFWPGASQWGLRIRRMLISDYWIDDSWCQMTERMFEELVFVVCSQSGWTTAVVKLFEPHEDIS